MISQAGALSYGTGSMEAQRYRGTDIFCACLPLFHHNALLAAAAAALACDGSVALSVHASSTPHVEYALPDRGRALAPVFGAMEVAADALFSDTQA